MPTSLAASSTRPSSSSSSTSPSTLPAKQASIAIRAPYVGAGLITVERDRIYNAKWFQTTTTESVQKIAIPPQLEGNGYITVTFVRSLDSPEIFTSPLSYGSVPFTISRARHTQEIKLDVPEMVRPGDTLKVGYQTAGPARIVLFAVDEGILAGRALQDSRPAFLLLSQAGARGNHRADSRPDSSRTPSPEPGVRPRRRQRGVAGAQLKTRSSARGRSRWRVWSGLIDSDGKPATFEVPVPDYFNGTIRVMAVAVTDSSDRGRRAQSRIAGRLRDSAAGAVLRRSRRRVRGHARWSPTTSRARRPTRRR